MPKITSYAALASVQPDDLLVGVDVHDTSMSAQGTTKQLTFAQVQYQPWQFIPELYGAKGDGKVIGDLVLNGTTTATSASAGFTSADSTKTIMINGGTSTTSGPLVVTITFVNSTTVTLSSAAGVSGSGFAAVYGTDDTSAVNSALAAAGSYALAHDYLGAVIFAAKIYMLASAPVQATSPFQQNAQVQVVPSGVDVTGASRRLIIQLLGAGTLGPQFWESTTPNVAGTALVSTTTAPSSVSGTYGVQSVIGGPSAGGAFTGGFANVQVIARDLSVWCGAYTNQCALDSAFLAGEEIAANANIFAPANAGQHPYLSDFTAQGGFQSTIGIGHRSPLAGNNDDVHVPSFTCEGYETHLWVADHFTGGRIATIYSDLAILIDMSHGISGLLHGVTIANWSCEVFNGALKANGGGGSYCSVDIFLDTETTGGSNPTYDVSDAGNTLHGTVRWSDPLRTVQAPVVSGAASLKVVNNVFGPGQWTGAMNPAVPAVPGSTNPQVNTSFRDATVYLTSGGAAVTVIKVDSVTTGLTLGTSGTVAYRVPSGHSTTLTYASTAPTWVWVLD